MRYTLDGSEVTEDSPLYTEPIEIRESCTVKARTDRNGLSGRTFTKSFAAHKAMGHQVTVLTETHRSYTFNCPDLLSDGVVSQGPYNSGELAGWYNKPFEAVIDMDGEAYDEVTLSAFVFKYDFIFGPTYLSVSTSADGNEYTEVARQDYPIDTEYDHGNGCREYTVNFPETSAKYLKVKAGCVEALPEWHSGNGRPGFVFVGEVIVK